MNLRKSVVSVAGVLMTLLLWSNAGIAGLAYEWRLIAAGRPGATIDNYYTTVPQIVTFGGAVASATATSLSSYGSVYYNSTYDCTLVVVHGLH